jgi:hypothetical protein
MKLGSAKELMTVKVATHQTEHKCSCLTCRQDRVREWVGKLLDWEIPAENILMDINQYGGKVIIYSGNQDLNAHHTHKQKWCYQFNDTTLEYAKTWWLAHHQPTLKEERITL